MEQKREITIQFLKFGTVGALATLTHYAILISLVETIDLNPVIASGLGYAISGALNYLLNYKYTFRSSSLHLVSGPRFGIVAASGLTLNVVIMHFGYELLKINYLVVQIIATLVVLFWNFLVNRHWTFKE